MSEGMLSGGFSRNLYGKMIFGIGTLSVSKISALEKLLHPCAFSRVLTVIVAEAVGYGVKRNVDEVGGSWTQQPQPTIDSNDES